MNQVRIHGDPFGDDHLASLLRSFLRLALGSGVRCSLSLAAVEPRAAAAEQRVVQLTDGGRDLSIGTRLPPAEIELLRRAANEVVAATAPVLVFARPAQRADALREAGLAWQRATAVLPVRDGATAADLLERVRAELRWAGTENPPHALEDRELASWLALPEVAAGGPIVGVVGEVFDDGADLTIATWRQHFANRGPRLRLVVTAGDPAVVEAVWSALGRDAAAAEVLVSGFEPAHVREAVAVVLPWRRLRSSRALVLALASGRPVCASRFAATAALLAAEGMCLPIGGRNVADGAGPVHFAPHAGALRTALQQAIADGATAARIGRRARAFVTEHLTRGRPASPPPPVPTVASPRPVVVLEAPFLATSAAAGSAIEMAQALCRRGRVDVRLVPTVPLRTRLATFRERAPELEARLCRDPGDVDLWLASGWPLRADRPACRTFALRIDEQQGPLPVELTPHVTQDADVVVVPSGHACCTVTAAGRSSADVVVAVPGDDADRAADAAIAIEELAFAAMARRGGEVPRGEPLFTLQYAPGVAAAPQLAPVAP